MAFAALGIITMFSCKKNDSPSTTATGSMTATINGASFSGNKCIADVEDTILNITGGTADGIGFDYPFIGIGVTGYHGVGTYTSTTIYNQMCKYYASSTDDTSLNHVSVHAVVNITATTPDVTGTFSFTTLDSTQITNGSFTAVIQ